MAGPPSPRTKPLPLPATVVMIPAVVTFRMRPLPVSAINRLPALSTATPEGGGAPPNAPLSTAQALIEIENFIRSRGFNFGTKTLRAFFASLRAKPFVILAGNSGTGKSRLARLFAEAVGANVDNGRFQMVPVRPDWNDSSDLLGYFDLNGDFRPGHLVATLLRADAQRDKPFFLCLDEMNLARVEHYFSDFLSIIESRRREKERRPADAQPR